MKILIENAWVLTMDEAMHDYKNGYVLTDGKQIAAVGEGPYEGECGERIDAKGGILIPGFVNTHCHASMMPFRTMGDDCQDRLRRFLFPLENEAVTPEFVYDGAMYGIAEMLLGGITTFVDMYYFENEVGRACEAAGIRGYIGETVLSQPTCDSKEPDGGLAYAETMFDRWKGHELVRPIVAPHGTTTVSAEALRRCAEMAERHSTLLTLHASEMDYEMTYFADRGTTPTAYMESLGMVNERLLAAHCIHMTPDDIEIMRRNGATVAHCIASNTKAGKGVAPIREMVQAGIRYGLGTDGASSGNTLSIFDQMRMFANCHKTKNHDRSLFTAKEILSAATKGGAAALGAGEEYGMIKPGMRADLALISTESVHMFPVFNPYSALVYSADASDVDTVMASGEVLVRAGKLTKLDLSDLRAKLLERMGPFMKSAEKFRDII